MTHYAGITRAATWMARSNGGINRDRSEQRFLDDLALVLMHTPHELEPIDRWLAEKSDAEVETIVDGEEREMQSALESAPPGTDMLLNDIFENAI
jgi:hypothetical protein